MEDEKDKDEKIEKLRFINGLMREMLEEQRKNMASIGIRPAKFPDFVYEHIQLMTFLEWLADELAHTEGDIEVGFGEDATLAELLEK